MRAVELFNGRHDLSPYREINRECMMGTLYICAYISAINYSNQTTFFLSIPAIPRCLLQNFNFTSKDLIFELYELINYLILFI